MKKSTLILVLLALSLHGFILRSGYAQGEKIEGIPLEQWEEIAADVEDFNFETSTMIVKVYSDVARASYQEVTILIAKQAKIVKNGEPFTLKDLRPGDNISVRYIVTENGKKLAYYLWVK